MSDNAPRKRPPRPFSLRLSPHELKEIERRAMNAGLSIGGIASLYSSRLRFLAAREDLRQIKLSSPVFWEKVDGLAIIWTKLPDSSRNSYFFGAARLSGAEENAEKASIPLFFNVTEKYLRNESYQICIIEIIFCPEI